MNQTLDRTEKFTMSKYQGSCHCGKVTFEFEGVLGQVFECNCSICSRKGAIWQPADNGHFRILTGKDELMLYQMGTRTTNISSASIAAVPRSAILAPPQASGLSTPGASIGWTSRFSRSTTLTARTGNEPHNNPWQPEHRVRSASVCRQARASAPLGSRIM